MGKGSGLWVPCYGEAFDHEKTMLVASRIAEYALDVPNPPVGVLPLEAFSIDSAVACLVRAHVGLLERNCPDGTFKIPIGQRHRFNAVAWPGLPPCFPMPLLDWFVEAGFAHLLRQNGTHEWYQLHEYEIHNSQILRKRKSYAAFCRKRSAQGSAQGSAVGSAQGSAPKQEDRKTGRQEDRKAVPSEQQVAAAVPWKKILDLWRDVKGLSKTRWVAHTSVPAGCEKALKARWDAVPDLQIWRLAMEACAQDDLWSGRKGTDRHEKGWRAGLTSFVRAEHFDRFVTEAKESDWRYAGDVDLAWDAWFTQVRDGAIEAQDVAYEGAWPTSGSLTPREQESAEKNLRAWWRTAIYDQENRDEDR